MKLYVFMYESYISILYSLMYLVFKELRIIKSFVDSLRSGKIFLDATEVNILGNDVNSTFYLKRAIRVLWIFICSAY